MDSRTGKPTVKALSEDTTLREETDCGLRPWSGKVKTNPVKCCKVLSINVQHCVA